MKRFFILSLLLPLIFVGCGKKTEEEVGVELKGISLNKKSLSMEIGDKAKLIVVYNPEEAAKFAPEVTWESSVPSVATVQDGKVTAKQKGKATITAYCGKFFADCEVIVETGGGSGGGGEGGGGEDAQKFEVTPTTIDDNGTGGTYTISVTSNRAWTASCEQSWATISPDNGTGDATVTVTVEANTEEAADAQTITFTAGALKKTVTVNRAGHHEIVPLTIDVKQKELGPEGGSFDVQVTSEAAWNVKCDDERVHITKNSDGASITVDINKKEFTRKIFYDSIPVVFYNDDVTDTLLVRQEFPYADISPSEFFSAYSLNYTCKVTSNISWSIVFDYDQSSTAKNYMVANPSSGTGETSVSVTIKKVHSDSQELTGGGDVRIKGTGIWAGLEAVRGYTDYHWANF